MGWVRGIESWLDPRSPFPFSSPPCPTVPHFGRSRAVAAFPSRCAHTCCLWSLQNPRATSQNQRSSLHARLAL